MRDRTRRFLHLEHPRKTRPGTPAQEPAPAGPTADRFEGVERAPERPAAPAGAGAPTGAGLGRFGPEPEPTLELADTDGRLPFIRCVRCGMDSNAFATECRGCGAPLDTPEQRAADAQLHEAHRAEAAREQAAAAVREEARAREAAETAAARRAMAESLAREVGDAERRRLDRDLPDGFGGGGGWGLEWPSRRAQGHADERAQERAGGPGGREPAASWPASGPPARWTGAPGGWTGGGGSELRSSEPLALRVWRALPTPGWRIAVATFTGLVILGLVVAGLAGLGQGGGRRGGLVALGVFLLVILAFPPGTSRRRLRFWGWW